MCKQARILCVDDEKNVLRALERIFLDDDYEIFTATSGEKGFEILREKKPVQVIISDYRMPGMNGVEFLKKVCKRWPDTIRIVLSGYADTGAVVDAINEGQIFKFIPKPWNDEELRVTIVKAVDHYFLQRKNSELTEELQQANEELRLLNENLEKMVEERTKEVLFRGQALAAAQNILDGLPVALLGLDPQGRIVQCNRKGAAFLTGQIQDLLGQDMDDALPVDLTDLLGQDMANALPAELIDFIPKISRAEERSEEIVIDGRSVTVTGAWFEGHGGQRGLILLLNV